MGRKYTSFHIITENKQKTIDEIKKIMIQYCATKSVYKSIAIKVFSNPEASDKINRVMNMTQDKNILVVTEKFVSIYDETISFESIVDFLKSYFANIHEPILYTANFNSSLLIMGVILDGRVQCSKNIGSGLYFYGIKPESTINKILDVHGFEFLTPNEDFIVSDSIALCEYSLESSLGIQLKFSVEDFYQNEANYKVIEEDSDFRILHRVFNM